MSATCYVCHRPLKNPRHAAAGIGPTCARKRGLVYARAPRAPRPSRGPRRRATPTPPSPFVEVPLFPEQP